MRITPPESPSKILSTIAFIILMIELFIMVALADTLVGVNIYLIALIDSAVLIVITIPLIYLLVIKPFIGSRQKIIADVNAEKQYAEHVAETLLSTQKNLVTLKAGMDKHSLISITDINGTITYANEKFCNVSGYQEHELIGASHSILNSNNQTKSYWKKMFSMTSSGNIWHDEVRNRAKNGDYYWVDTTIIPLYENNQLNGYLSIRTDITELKKQQEALAQLAHYDALTKLPNRALFVERFNQAIAFSNRSAGKVALCFLDLNKFKQVNDNYGHDVGDKLLIEVANRLTTSLRKVDTVSRQGGDEFLAVLSNVDDISMVNKLLTRIHKSFAKPFMIENLSLSIGASIGIAIYPDDGSDAETLLRKSDKAMYKDKMQPK